MRNAARGFKTPEDPRFEAEPQLDSGAARWQFCRHDSALYTLGRFPMTQPADFQERPPFEVSMPDGQRVPFVFSSPHSGRHYPDRFLRLARLDREAIRRSEDCHVDALFAGVVDLGAPLIHANFPRAYLDVNREPWELDPRMFHDPVPSFANTKSARVAGGLGTVPRVVGEGQNIYAGRLPVSEAIYRVEAAYKPYHARLCRLLTDTHEQFGHAVLIDCHSMPGSIRMGDSGLKPDFIVGDRFGTSASAAISAHAISVLGAMGYTVAHNRPYAGGFITEHYGRPSRGLHALQVEVNRGLYMNERTYVRTQQFAAIALDLQRFAAEMTTMTVEEYEQPPLAAE
jgi:N-formylglutamate amidohydrolase